jgi:hypothetical protein
VLRGEGDDHGEAYTVIIWGVGLSHDLCSAAMQGTVALPVSKATSWMNGSRRNLGDLTPPAVAKAIPGPNRKSRRPSCWGRREESDASVVPMKPRTKTDHKSEAERVEGGRPVEGKESSDARPGLRAGPGVSLKRRAYGLTVCGLPSSLDRV